MPRALVRATVTLALLLVPALALAQPEAGEPGRLVIRDRAFYIPFEKLEEVFEKTGRGIFLPYEEFIELWELKHRPPDTPDGTPPTEAVIRGGHYKGTVSGNVARFEVSYTIEALQEEWSDVALPLRGVAVESVELSSPDALFAAEADGYRAYFPRPGTYELKLRLAAAVTSAPGRKSFDFGIPATAVSRLELSIPEEDIRVDVKPSLAVTQTPTDDGASTQVLAFLGNSTTVAVHWMPPVGKVGEDGAILFARQAISAHLGERILRVSTRIEYSVERGEVDTLRIRMPENTMILSVRGDNMREWQPEDGVLTVSLHSPISGTYALELSFERILEETPETLAVPFPRAEGVTREKGYALLSHDEGLLLRVAGSTGLSQLDPGSIPEGLRSPSLRVGFRYLAHPIGLDLAITRIEPVVRAASTSIVVLGREEDLLLGWVDYSVAKAGIFNVSFRVDGSWNVDTVGQPGTIEEFQVTEADGKKTVAVSLKSRVLGTFRLPFRLVRQGSAVFADGAARPGLTVLAPEVLGASEDRGLLGISAPRAVEIITGTVTGAREVSDRELFGSGIMGQLTTETALPRAYRYRTQPASVALTLAEKKTEIEVLAQHLIHVADGKISFAHLLDYNVLYAPVTELRFLAPRTLDGELTIQAKNKVDEKFEAYPANPSLTLWRISFQPPALGATTITVTHSEKLQGLQAGQPSEHPVPLVRPTAVRSEEGFVAVQKAGTLEITPAMQEMESIDAGELPDKLRRGQIYSAFRYFTAAPNLTLSLTRYDYEKLPTTSVALARAKSLLTEERILDTQLTLFVQNTGSQYLDIDIPSEAIGELHVNGQPVQAKKREGSGTLIEIPPTPRGALLPVEIRYATVTGSRMGSFGSVTIEIPEIRAVGSDREVPVSKVELELYVPPEYAYMGWGGTLHRREAHGSGLWRRFQGIVEGRVNRGTHQAAAWFQQYPNGSFTQVLPTGDFKRYDFDSLAPAPEVHFYYTGWTLYGLLALIAFVAGIVGTHRYLTTVARSRLQEGTALFVLGLVLVWFTSRPGQGFFLSLWLGCTVVCMILVARAASDRWNARKQARLALAPDPFIEDAPSAPPAPATPPTPPTPTSSDAAPKAAAPDAPKAPETSESSETKAATPEPPADAAESKSSPATAKDEKPPQKPKKKKPKKGKPGEEK